jgi:electron transport complex protein RnfD
MMFQDNRTTADIRLPQRLDLGSAPHLAGGETFTQITWTTLAVAGLAGLAGAGIFGLIAAATLATCVLTALATEWVYVRLSAGRVMPSFAHAALTGLLVGLTLPVGRCDGAGFHPLGSEVPICASLAAILVGKGLMGGMGNYLWHPALVGRTAAELLLPDQMQPTRWAVLGYRHLFAAVPHPAMALEYTGWKSSLPPDGFNAWALVRPLEWLRKLADGQLLDGGGNPLTGLIRDTLPPWEDTLLGGVGGCIGETCTIALIVGGLYLMYRGYVRWQQPVSVLLAAAVAAAVLPIRIGEAGSPAWFPGLEVDHSLPVGAIYVLYHLTGGGLMLGAFFFVTDMVASPRTIRGQIIFGAGIGVLTIVLRLYGPTPGACYWAILIMNTLVGPIDRRTKRRVMGT